MYRLGLTRRGFVGGLIPGLLAGCFTDDSTDEGNTSQTLSEIELPDEPIERSETTIASWIPHAPSGILEDLISDKSSRSIRLEEHVYPSRSAQEEAVATAMVQSSPPGTFQTVLGGELHRYVEAATVHSTVEPIANLTVSDRIRRLITHEDTPYAVPVTRDLTNRLFVRKDRPRTLDFLESVTSLQDLGNEDGTGEFVIADSPHAGFRVLCVLLLAETAVETYLAFGNGNIETDVLRSVFELLGDILHRRARIVDDRSAVLQEFEAGDADYLFGSAEAAARLSHNATTAWRSLQVPGTEGIASLHATGWCHPKRTSTPHGTSSVLATLAKPAVQSELAKHTHAAPAAVDAPTPPGYPTTLSQTIENATSVVPAISTGVGIDANDRYHAKQSLTPSTIRETDPSQLTADLIARVD